MNETERDLRVRKKVEEIFNRYNYRKDHFRELSQTRFSYDHDDMVDEEIWIYKKQLSKGFVLLINYIDASLYFYKEVSKDFDDITREASKILSSRALSERVIQKLNELGFEKISKSTYFNPDPYNTYIIRKTLGGFEFYYLTNAYDLSNGCWPKDIEENIKYYQKMKEQNLDTNSTQKTLQEF